MTLTEFLLARIAEDEAAARKATEDDRPDTHADYEVEGWPSCEHPGRVVVVGPERWLAEVAAKRSIVEFHEPFECSNVRCKGNGLHCRTCDEGWAADYEHVYSPCLTLRALAAVYSDHPDYDEEWRP